MNEVLIPEPHIDYDVNIDCLLYGEDSLPENLDTLEWM